MEAFEYHDRLIIGFIGADAEHVIVRPGASPVSLQLLDKAWYGLGNLVVITFVAGNQGL